MVNKPEDPTVPLEHDAPSAQPTPTARSQDMRLHPSRPPVTRLSRKVLIGLGATASVAILAALTYALLPRHETPPPSSVNTAHNAPEGLAKLPRDYTGFATAAPKLGPPLPGDLGKPMLKAGVLPPAMAMPAPSPEQQRITQEQDAAHTSHLFATTNISPPPVPSMAAPAQASAPVVPSGASDQDHKLAFLTGLADRQTESPNRLQGASSPYVLQAGAVIPAALMTGLRSDLPGEVTAQVTEDCYDSLTGKILLVPQGSRLIGQYDAQITFGQSRALLVWNRLILPNGRSLILERQPGTDTQGYAGLEDQVDEHWGKLFEAATLSTILSVGTEAGTSNSENNLAQAVRQGASQSFNQVGQQVVGRSLNVQPTITIRPGFPVRVLVTHDLVLEPYKA